MKNNKHENNFSGRKIKVTGVTILLCVFSIKIFLDYRIHNVL